MWHLSKIPKILHVYWGGGKLAYLRYLTIKSFKRLNPDWEIFFYCPAIVRQGHSWKTNEQKYAERYDDCLSVLTSRTDIIIKPIDFASIGFSNQASAVHKSDFLRWGVLSNPGGLWVDMDILFMRPMDDIYFNTEENANINTVVCIGGYGHSIGFLMGGEGSTYFDVIKRNARSKYNREKYQCIGSLLCNELFPTIESAQAGNSVPFNLSMEVVYAYDTYHLKELFGVASINRFTDKTIGVHWYGGSREAGRYLNITNGGLYAHENSIIDKLIRNED